MGELIALEPRSPSDGGLPARGEPAAVIGLTDRAVYTVTEVARLLSLSRGTAYALVRDGTIPARRLGGRWVISRARFHAWLDEQREQPDAARASMSPGRGGR